MLPEGGRQHRLVHSLTPKNTRLVNPPQKRPRHCMLLVCAVQNGIASVCMQMFVSFSLPLSLSLINACCKTGKRNRTVFCLPSNAVCAAAKSTPPNSLEEDAIVHRRPEKNPEIHKYRLKNCTNTTKQKTAPRNGSTNKWSGRGLPVRWSVFDRVFRVRILTGGATAAQHGRGGRAWRDVRRAVTLPGRHPRGEVRGTGEAR